MLQQTQVATVLPYWHRWMERFPTVQALAEADEQTVLAAWQGLGYYRRCRLLHDGARIVCQIGVPTKATDWQKVPGIGRYTAGAIASIAFDEAVALVDGNVERVYARLTGDYALGASLNKKAWEWAESNIYLERPGDWNQALMELGATVCRPMNPDCSACPLSSSCTAFQQGLVSVLPIPKPKTEVIPLKYFVCVPRWRDLFGIRQISMGRWWEGMWEFPTETNEAPDFAAILGPGSQDVIGRFNHSVTHHRILVRVSVYQCETQFENLRWVDGDSLSEIPLPSLQRKALRIVMDSEAFSFV
jgi:A/G-specific adenine glycosylase